MVEFGQISDDKFVQRFIHAALPVEVVPVFGKCKRVNKHKRDGA